MIITNICRGLGNQMFRYAAGRALSLRYGCPLKLDTSWFSVFARNNNLFGACTARQYLLPIFNLPCEIATKEEITGFTQDNVGEYSTWLANFNLWPEPLSCICVAKPKTPNYSQIKENTFSDTTLDSIGLDVYWEDFSNITPPAYIHGNFLCERYFKDIREQLIQDFAFPELPPECLTIRDSITKYANSISLHVRHGDYLVQDSIMGRKRFVVIDMDYYKKAIEYIIERVTDAVIFVFSDDMDWCREHICTSGSPVIFVDLQSEQTCYHDMHLMSLCRHHIIANSTFSWWGAWISKESGITCSPQQWYQEQTFMHYNPSAEGWVRIENGSLHFPRA